MADADHDVMDAGSLPALLAERARLASDRRLALEAAVGMLGAVGAAIFKPPLWIPVAGLALCLAAYGGWGILDREVRDVAARGGAASPGLLTARGAVAVIGTLAGILGGLSLFFAALGTWIS